MLIQTGHEAGRFVLLLIVLPPDAPAKVVARWNGYHPIQDEMAQADAVGLELLHQSLRFRKHHTLWAGYDHKLGYVAVGEQPSYMLDSFFEYQKPVVGFTGCGFCTEGPDHLKVFLAKSRHHLDPVIQQVGKVQQAQRMAGGGRIHNYLLIGIGFQVFSDLDKRHNLIQTGDGQLKKLLGVFLVQVGSLDNQLLKRAAVLPAEGIERFLCIQLLDVQIILPGIWADGVTNGSIHIQAVGERVRRVGRGQ